MSVQELLVGYIYNIICLEFQEELKSNKGKKVEDPFTRRNTKPRIVSKPISGLVLGLGLENLPGFGTPKLENGDVTVSYLFLA